MANLWTGRKKLALVPVFRPNAHPPDRIPADWNGDILRRMLFDPTRIPAPTVRSAPISIPHRLDWLTSMRS